jgi:hypothetical protein
MSGTNLNNVQPSVTSVSAVNTGEDVGISNYKISTWGTSISEIFQFEYLITYSSGSSRLPKNGFVFRDGIISNTEDPVSNTYTVPVPTDDMSQSNYTINPGAVIKFRLWGNNMTVSKWSIPFVTNNPPKQPTIMSFQHKANNTAISDDDEIQLLVKTELSGLTYASDLVYVLAYNYTTEEEGVDVMKYGISDVLSINESGSEVVQSMNSYDEVIITFNIGDDVKNSSGINVAVYALYPFNDIDQFTSTQNNFYTISQLSESTFDTAREYESLAPTVNLLKNVVNPTYSSISDAILFTNTVYDLSTQEVYMSGDVPSVADLVGYTPAEYSVMVDGVTSGVHVTVNANSGKLTATLNASGTGSDLFYGGNTTHDVQFRVRYDNDDARIYTSNAVTIEKIIVPIVPSQDQSAKIEDSTTIGGNNEYTFSYLTDPNLSPLNDPKLYYQILAVGTDSNLNEVTYELESPQSEDVIDEFGAIIPQIIVADSFISQTLPTTVGGNAVTWDTVNKIIIWIALPSESHNTLYLLESSRLIQMFPNNSTGWQRIVKDIEFSDAPFIDSTTTSITKELDGTCTVTFSVYTESDRLKKGIFSFVIQNVAAESALLDTQSVNLLTDTDYTNVEPVGITLPFVWTIDSKSYAISFNLQANEPNYEVDPACVIKLVDTKGRTAVNIVNPTES